MDKIRVILKSLQDSALGVMLSVGLMACSSDTNSGNSSFATLTIEPGAYSKTLLSVHPDAFSLTEGDARFQLPTNCVNQSEATRCRLEFLDLARVRCQVYSGGTLTVLSAKAQEQRVGSDTEMIPNGCPTEIICGFAPLTIDEEDSMGDLRLRSSSIQVPVSSIADCSGAESSIVCSAARSNCEQDGFDCSYTLSCVHSYE